MVIPSSLSSEGGIRLLLAAVPFVLSTVAAIVTRRMTSEYQLLANESINLPGGFYFLGLRIFVWFRNFCFACCASLLLRSRVDYDSIMVVLMVIISISFDVVNLKAAPSGGQLDGGRFYWFLSYACALGYFVTNFRPLDFILITIWCLGIAARTAQIFKKASHERAGLTEEFTSGFFQYITFSFINNLINLGDSNKPLEFSDVPFLISDDCCDIIDSKFELLTANGRYSLLISLCKLIRAEFSLQFAYQLSSSVANFFAPLGLHRVLQYIAQSTEGEQSSPAVPSTMLESMLAFDLTTAVLLLFLGPMIRVVCDSQNYTIGKRVCIRIRAALLSHLYKKVLVVDISDQGTGGPGGINNMISVDMFQIQEAFTYFNFTWSCVFEVLVCVSLLYLLLGVSFIGGFVVMLLTIPLGTAATHYTEKYQKILSTIKDERMDVINEILTGIRVIKWFVWEKSVRSKAEEIRHRELRSLRTVIFCDAALRITWGVIPTAVGVVTFMIHTQVLKKSLSTTAGFTALLLFNLLRRPLEQMPEMVNIIVCAWVSIERLKSFLNCRDVVGLRGLQHADTATTTTATTAVSTVRASRSPLIIDKYDNAGLEMEDLGRDLERKATESERIVASFTNVSLAWRAANASSNISTPQRMNPDIASFSANSNIKQGSVRTAGSIATGTSCDDISSLLVESSRGILSATKPSRFRSMTGFRRKRAGYEALPTANENTRHSVEIDISNYCSDTEDFCIDDNISDYSFVLSDISLVVNRGDLVAVVGSTGSGKSTILAGLVGECCYLKGTVYLKGNEKISLVTQSAWIQNASLRDNVLFGSPYDEERYVAVLKACALEADLKEFPDGDMTDIGEKGVNLSGGQQQRVALARAAYSDSSTILLDDPLSAVDSHVCAHIFERLICGFLSDRTRVVVTHQLGLVLPRATTVLCLNGQGGMVAFCPPASLGAALASRGEISSSHTGENLPQQLEPTDRGFLAVLAAVLQAPEKPASSEMAALLPFESNPDGTRNGMRDMKNEAMIPGASNKSPNYLVTKEEKTSGSIGFDVYWWYLSSGGGFVAVLAVLASNVGVPLALFLQDLHLGYWMTAVEAFVASPSTILPGINTTKWGEDNMTNLSTSLNATGVNMTAVASGSTSSLRSSLILYLACVLCVVLATCTRDIIRVFLSLKASSKLHGALLSKVLGATISWHDSQPTGRKVNRFSQDIGTIDSSVMRNLQDFLSCALSTLQVVLVMSVLLPVMLVVLSPVFIYVFITARKYIRTSRELKRLESIGKSPVFVLFSETVNGVSIVRSFGSESVFFSTCCDRIDLMNRCYYYMWVTNRWITFRSQFIGALTTGFVSVAVVLEGRQMGNTLAALALLYANAFAQNLSYSLRSHANCQMSMNSVERLIEYSKIEQERYAQSEDDEDGNDLRFDEKEVQCSSNTAATSKGLSDWLIDGSVEFSNISLQYRPSTPLVLKGVSFRIESGMKVGVCGRSGAGKSSLIAALFRTIEPCGGDLLLGGENVLKMPLRRLRAALAIVPQDPILFKGSIKSNLDPFNECGDSSLWIALRKVHMADYVAAMPGGSGEPSGPLDEKKVSDRGSNLSVGQKQLLCMARAIVREAKILILDEATANVDAGTDALIQETVRNELDKVTVISIAHRLHTISYYDKVLVMNYGEVVEFDAPYLLLRRHGSLFYSMCAQSGDFSEIYNSAKEMYTTKNL